MGMVLDYHLCRGEIKNIGIYSKAEPCENAKNTQHKSEDSKSCCTKPKERAPKIFIPDFFSKGKSQSYSDIPCCAHESAFFQLNVESPNSFPSFFLEEGNNISIPNLGWPLFFKSHEIHKLFFIPKWEAPPLFKPSIIILIESYLL
jgi:hypothetical protein